ncbi:MAG: UDP-GlcNAc:undecaprenyl-phosphate GlcNAc-1-phosphate transferase [Halieaceae bacterium]|jgi:UDP-GlcNAc:undecaprenyl-phosphate GlcNAc-1-phosphate transferase
MNPLNLTYSKLFLLVVTSYFVAGLFGPAAVVFMLVFCSYNLRSKIAMDATDKHGISSSAATRCGGIAIWLLTLALLVTNGIFARETTPYFPNGHSDWNLIILPAGFFLMGLIEDTTGRFSATARLSLMLGGCIWFLIENAQLMPQKLDLPILDWMLGIPWLAYTILMVCMVGVVNAFNTSDGANGLLTGTAVLLGCVFVKLMEAPYIWEVFLTCWTLFLLVNVVTGKMFLGDSGSYLLGALFAVGFLWLYKTVDISFVLILNLVFYPVLDFLMAMARRIRHRRPLMEPDDCHFHNLLFDFFQHHISDKTIANSATGLTIAAAWPGTAVALLYLGVPATSDTWLWVFFLSFVAFGIMRYALNRWLANNTEIAPVTAQHRGRELGDTAV